MQTFAEPAKSLPKQPIATKAIVWVLFLLWTFLLSGITWEIQHSCAPIIAWSDILPAKCHPQKDTHTAQRSLIPNWLTHSDHNDLISQKPQEPPSVITSNAIATASGTAVAIVSAVAGAPAIVTACLGVAMWFFIKFFIKGASVS